MKNIYSLVSFASALAVLSMLAACGDDEVTAPPPDMPIIRGTCVYEDGSFVRLGMVVGMLTITAQDGGMEVEHYHDEEETFSFYELEDAGSVSFYVLCGVHTVVRLYNMVDQDNIILITSNVPFTGEAGTSQYEHWFERQTAVALSLTPYGAEFDSSGYAKLWPAVEFIPPPSP